MIYLFKYGGGEYLGIEIHFQQFLMQLIFDGMNILSSIAVDILQLRGIC